MRRYDQEPVKTKTDNMGDTYEHPAYAMLGASRVTGRTRLVGSELVHNHYVVVKLVQAQKNRSLHRDWWSGDIKGIIEVAMSEAQWASFVSSMNIGSGTPCTLQYGPTEDADYEYKPGIKEPSKHELATDELEQSGAEITKELTALTKRLKGMVEGDESVSKKAMRDHIKAVEQAVMHIVSNLPFHIDQHKELMEKNVQAAKSDVEGFITDTVMRLGIEGMAEKMPVLENKTKG